MRLSISSNTHLAPRSFAHLGTQSTAQAVRESVLVKPVVRWAFYAFIFSILFEEVPIGIPLEVTQITGVLLALGALLIQPRLCFRRPPAAFWCFVLYFCIGFLSLFLYGSFLEGDVILRQFKVLQLLILFWIAYNLMRDERAAKGVLISFVASCTVLSLLQVFGLITTTAEALSKTDRLSAFGLGPGHVAGLLSLGVLALVGLVFGLRRNVVRLRLLIWPIFALIGMTIVQTGSRGGLLALGAGLMVFTLRKGTVLAKLRNVVVVLLGIGFFAWITYSAELTQSRFQKTLDSGSMTRREEIYPLALQMFMEKPFIGWGPVANTIELGSRLQIPTYERMDTHNQVLYVLTATGIFGAMPFFTGVWLCVRAAWKARGGAHGILPLAMTVSLLTASMSSSGLHWKQYWLFLAYALASNGLFVIKPRRLSFKPAALILCPETAGNR